MEPTTADARVAALEAELAAARAQMAELTKERDNLRASHERLRLELEMLRRRIFVATAERVDTAQLELEFAETLAKLDQLGGLLPKADAPAGPKGSRKPTGRRNLNTLDLEKERIEIPDEIFEKLVAEGKAQRIGFEESYKFAWKRGGARCLVVARVKYRTIDSHGESLVETAVMPPELFPRSLAAPSALAHVLNDKFCDGLPFNRIEDRLERDGFALDRGTMCRWAEDAGATVGATVLEAARQEALATSFCIATDATGVKVQPEPRPDHKRQPCRRGHFFVWIADRDHVFFEYTPKETSEFVLEMFEGYSGYIQADAKSVYDALFKEPDKPPDEEEEPGVRLEIGCMSHCRRHFWEATCTKSEVAREGLARIGHMFALEEAWRSDPPDVILRLRNQHLRPHLEAFFGWAEAQYQRVRDQRGPVRSALGYAVRQKDALMRVLDDGRLVFENNRSERALRTIAVGRRGWLFIGDDDHGQSTANLFSIIASARLHRLDPEGYLRDLFRVLPHWPDDRYLELAPKYWARTKARLDPVELAREIGLLTVPPPLSTPEEQQPAN